MDEVVQSIRVSEIRSMMNTALSALEAAGVEEVDFDHDGYWSVGSDDAFDLAKTPDLQVGTLQDDIGDLRVDMKSIANEEGAAVWHMFHHLRGVVLLLAEYSRAKLI